MTRIRSSRSSPSPSSPGSAWPSLADRGADAQAPKRGGVLTLARQGEATNLDPHKVPAFTSHRVFELVYSTLTRLGPDLLVQPDLAESWTISPDGKQISVPPPGREVPQRRPGDERGREVHARANRQSGHEGRRPRVLRRHRPDRGAGSPHGGPPPQAAERRPARLPRAPERQRDLPEGGRRGRRRPLAEGARHRIGPVPAGRVGARQLHALRGVPRVLRPGPAVPRRGPDQHRAGRGRTGRRASHQGRRRGPDRRRPGRPDASRGRRG